MILGSVWKHQRTIYSCEGIKSCDFGPNAGLGIFLTDMNVITRKKYAVRFSIRPLQFCLETHEDL